MSRIREVLVTAGLALRPGRRTAAHLVSRFLAAHPARRRAAHEVRRREQVSSARQQARQSQAELARARAAARDLAGLRDSRVASELSRNLRGQS